MKSKSLCICGFSEKLIPLQNHLEVTILTRYFVQKIAANKKSLLHSIDFALKALRFFSVYFLSL